MLTLGTDCFVVAMKLGNSSGAEGAGHPIHDRFIMVNRQREEAFDLNEGRRRSSLDDMSRVSREAHVRICEGTGGVIPPAYSVQCMKSAATVPCKKLSAYTDRRFGMQQIAGRKMPISVARG
jgi:hypothetical protein